MIDPILLVGPVLKVGFLLVGIEYLLWTLRRLDKRAGLEWREKIVPLLEGNALASGVYFGLRFVGTAVAVAIAVS